MEYNIVIHSRSWSPLIQRINSSHLAAKMYLLLNPTEWSTIPKYDYYCSSAILHMYIEDTR
jgi:hypothetical protein